MRVNFCATFRRLAGAKTVDLPLQEEVAVSDLLRALVAAHPPLRCEIVDEDGSLLDHGHVFINGRETKYLPGGWQRACVQRIKLISSHRSVAAHGNKVFNSYGF